jgi:hypothetical protein
MCCPWHEEFCGSLERIKCLQTSVTKKKTLVEKREDQFQEVCTYYLSVALLELFISEVILFVLGCVIYFY